ncbi:MAG: hypothetical protein FJX56_10710 [Alphaproteobacteria bacterium]|nr:hypothetical protein [Alphaproteobacteria bacterium]
MTMPDEVAAVQRLLVALDTARDSRDVIELAAEYAARLNAELMGLFVEDTALLTLAALPCAREVRLASARAKRISVPTVERQLRVRESATRSALEAVARMRKVSWSFQVTRGRATSVPLEAAPEIDLIMVTAASWRLVRRVGVYGWRPGPSRILVTFDGSAEGRRALEVAGQLADGAAVSVLVPAIGPRIRQRLMRQAGTILGARGVRPRFRKIKPGNLSRVIQVVGDNPAALCVIACGSKVLGGRPVEELTSRLRVPAILVRPVRA